jgi:hypothetical protein
MSARIEKDFTFLGGVFFDETYMMNLYTMTLYIDILTDNEQEQLIAIERIHYFLKNYIEHSVFVCEEHKSQITLFEKAGLTVLTIPEEPFDQIVGIILLRKFNAIAEGRVVVSEIKFGSKLSSDIKFHNDIEEAEDFNEVAWYNDSTLSIQHTAKKSKKDKIVKFDELEDWTKIGLVWKS